MRRTSRASPAAGVDRPDADLGGGAVGEPEQLVVAGRRRRRRGVPRRPRPCRGGRVRRRPGCRSARGGRSGPPRRWPGRCAGGRTRPWRGVMRSTPSRPATFRSSTRCAPLVRISSGSSPTAKTRLLAIAPTGTPRAAAAAAAVRTSAGSTRSSPGAPASARSRATSATRGCSGADMRVILPPASGRLPTRSGATVVAVLTAPARSGLLDVFEHMFERAGHCRSTTAPRPFPARSSGRGRWGAVRRARWGVCHEPGAR